MSPFLFVQINQPQYEQLTPVQRKSQEDVIEVIEADYTSPFLFVQMNQP